MTSAGTWSIGELAEHAGVSVKTVRFYTDRGLLPGSARSAGGHRRYDPESLNRLRLIRSLRALELPLPDVSRVLDREDALEDVLAGRLREAGRQLTAMRWREAALHLLHDSAPGERAERLRLVGALSLPPGTDPLARFWRRWLPPRLPARLVSALLDDAVPEPPADPTPGQVLAFAELNAMVSGPCPGGPGHCQPAAHRTGEGHRPAVLYDGLREAYTLAASRIRDRRSPHEGEALDCFVAAYAHSRGAKDTPAFRDVLGRELGDDPRIDRYWELVAEVTGPSRPTAGAAHDWLYAALTGGAGAQAADTDGGMDGPTV